MRGEHGVRVSRDGLEDRLLAACCEMIGALGQETDLDHLLRLIARGASNKEVAARLVISPKTAGTHIEHIYAKLGVSSRAEAGLFAVQHGLLPETAFDPPGDHAPAPSL